MGSPGKSARGRKGRLASAGTAATPSRAMPRRVSLRRIALRVWKRFWADQIPMIAAGMTFYSLLALFPAIGFFVSLWGLLGDLGKARAALAHLATFLPGGALTVVGDEMARVSGTGTGGLTLATAFGLALSIWTANGAMSAMLTGLNIAYEQKEERSFVRRTLVALAFTCGFITFALASGAVLALPAALRDDPIGGGIVLFRMAGFGALFMAGLIGLSLLYHFGPSRHLSRWRWFTWGGAIAGVAWLTSSVSFTLYVAHFGSYNRTYGSLGAVVGFMTWIWISAMVVLAGAEVNAEVEQIDGPRS